MINPRLNRLVYRNTSCGDNTSWIIANAPNWIIDKQGRKLIKPTEEKTSKRGWLVGTNYSKLNKESIEYYIK